MPPKSNPWFGYSYKYSQQFHSKIGYSEVVIKKKDTNGNGSHCR